MKKTFLELVDFIRQRNRENRKFIYILTIGSMAESAVSMISLYYSAQILNNVSGRKFEEAARLAMVMILLLLGTGVLSKGCSEIFFLTKQRIRMAQEEKIARKSFTIQYEEMEKPQTKETLSKLATFDSSWGGSGMHLEFVHKIFVSGFGTLFSEVFLVGLALQTSTGSSLNFFTSAWSTLLLAVIYVLAFLGTRHIRKKIMEKRFRQQEANVRNNLVGNYFTECCTDSRLQKDIRLYGLDRVIAPRLQEGQDQALGLFEMTGKWDGQAEAKISVLMQACSWLAYLIIGVKALYGVIGIGSVLMYAGAIICFAQSLQQIFQTAQNFTRYNEYQKVADGYMNCPDMEYDGTLPVEKRDDMEYELEFKNVSFAYPGAETMMLRNFSLKIRAGERLALVGKNGAGKTTLIKLLCRLYEPMEGEILLNQIPIRFYNYKEYTKIFSVVFQDFGLLAFPVEENVAIGNTADKERLWDALERVGIAERVKRLKQKENTYLYHDVEEGVNVSGGEAQKLAMARAVYKDAPFLILDEPTAALDPIAEAEIYSHFDAVVQNKTAVYISHRMSSCRFCDRIIVLDNGEIAEEGDHHYLMEKNGIYAKLYQAQAQYYQEKP